jgi:hypothetical protein
MHRSVIGNPSACFEENYNSICQQERQYRVAMIQVRERDDLGDEPRDRILHHGEAGRVELVADADRETAWYLEPFGVGCTLAVPSFGLVCLKPDEGLELVGRDSGH